MPHASPSASSDGYDIAFKVLLGALAIAVPLSNLAWLCGNLAAWATHSGPWAPYQPINALLHPASSGPPPEKRPCSSVPASSPSP